MGARLWHGMQVKTRKERLPPGLLGGSVERWRCGVVDLIERSGMLRLTRLKQESLSALFLFLDQPRCNIANQVNQHPASSPQVD